MGFHLKQTILKETRLKGAKLHMLLELSELASDDTEEGFIHIPTLMQRMKLSRAEVYKLIHSLSADGCLFLAPKRSKIRGFKVIHRASSEVIPNLSTVVSKTRLPKSRKRDYPRGTHYRVFNKGELGEGAQPRASASHPISEFQFNCICGFTGNDDGTVPLAPHSMGTRDARFACPRCKRYFPREGDPSQLELNGR